VKEFKEGQKDESSPEKKSEVEDNTK